MFNLTVNIRSAPPVAKWENLPAKIKKYFLNDDLNNLLIELKNHKKDIEHYPVINYKKRKKPYSPNLASIQEHYICIEENIAYDFIFKFLISHPRIKAPNILFSAFVNYQLTFLNFYYSYYTFFINYFLTKKQKEALFTQLGLSTTLWMELMKQRNFYNSVIYKEKFNASYYIPNYIYDIGREFLLINHPSSQYHFKKNKTPILFFILKEKSLSSWQIIKRQSQYLKYKTQFINFCQITPEALTQIGIKEFKLIAQNMPEFFLEVTSKKFGNISFFKCTLELLFKDFKHLSDKEIQKNFNLLFFLFKNRPTKPLFFLHKQFLIDFFKKMNDCQLWNNLLSLIELEEFKDINLKNITYSHKKL